MSATVISVVSGKGGAGKSLLTSVLGRALGREAHRVLIVDLDIFVRGLTVLLYSFQKPPKDSDLTVSDILGVFSEGSQEKGPLVEKLRSNLSIQRFLEVDMLPSVRRINWPLDYDDRSLSDEHFCLDVLESLIVATKQDYDYIFLDNRAGMDSLVSASCRVSDVVVSVAEDDEVARQTDSNLVQFLQTKGIAKSVYSVINKGRGIKSARDIDEVGPSRHNFGSLGVVPFDIEIMDDFGGTKFWDTVFSSLYFYGVLKAWNRLAEIEQIAPISKNRYSFPPRVFMAASSGRYSLFERMMRVYGVMLSLGGVGYIVYRQFEESITRDPGLVAAVAAVGAGVIGMFLSTSGLQEFLRGGSSSRD